MKKKDLQEKAVMRKILRDTCIFAALMILTVFAFSITGVGLTEEIKLVFELFGLAFILSVIVYHEMSLKEVFNALIETARETAGIMCIICGAAAFSWLVTMLGLTSELSEILVSITDNKYVILLVLNIAFLIIGMFMEALAAMTITLPFLLPLMQAYGIDPLHLGVVLVLNLMIGLCTPPVGTSLFICAKTAGISIERMYKAILPFLVPLILVLFLITYVPGLVTWLPGLMG